MKNNFLLLLLSTFVFSFNCSQPSEPGQPQTFENIGFQVLEFVRKTEFVNQDSIEIGKDHGKKIPVSIWYPLTDAAAEGFPKMVWQEYVKEIKQGKTLAENKSLFTRMLNAYGEIDSARQEELINEFLGKEIPVYSSSDFPAEKFPLLMICGAHPIYHADLAERLAREGYIVASFPRLGKKEGERLAFSSEGGAEFRKDLDFVISSLNDFAWTEEKRLSFVCWSFEGVPAWESAVSNKNTRLFVSFDSSLGYEYGRDLISDSTAFSGGNASFPLLHFTSSSMDFGKDLSLLQEMQNHSKQISVTDSIEMTHAQFTSIASVTLNQIGKENSLPEYIDLLESVVEALEINVRREG